MTKIVTIGDIHDLAKRASSRLDFWAEFINRRQVAVFAEIGVWKGEFAEGILRHCPCIQRYYMVDPWRHLEGWNKPSNVSDSQFAQIYEEAMRRTAFAEERRIVLRAKTTEALPRLEDGELDALYIDGNHTLRGITIDLVSLYSKVKSDGFIAGDDFTPTIWQHPTQFEPTLVFPWAVYFAEAKGDTIFGLPFNQFLIAKDPERDAFRFHDLTGRYAEMALRGRMLSRPESSD